MGLHPANMERVTEATVTAELDAAGVPFASVWTVEPGVVRVDVTARPGFRLAVARERVALALENRRRSDFWTVHPAGVAYRWRPWRSTVTVRDPGLDWVNSATGRTYLGTPTD
jgi:hypothetical protein